MNHSEYTKIEALNWSTLKRLNTSPAYLKHLDDHPDEDVDKPAYAFGRAIHCYILEPEKFAEKYVVVPDFAQMARDEHGSLRTKAAKDMRDSLAAEFEADAPPDAERLTDMEMNAITRSAEAIKKNSDAVSLFEQCQQREHLVEWVSDGGIKCKARLDMLGTRVVDLKSTRRTSLHDILRDAAIFGYHAQCAWYHDGAVAAGLIDGDVLPACIFIHAPTSGTFADVVVLDMDVSRLTYGVGLTYDIGRSQYQRLLELYAGCRAANYWPGMAPQSQPWELPEWYARKEE